jgi:hypothetical protein
LVLVALFSLLQIKWVFLENKIKILTLLLAPKDLTAEVSKRLAIVTSFGAEIQVVPKTFEVGL